ncbi:hypothetical protein SLS60_000023 [Paraconiothyrium brasiliense]|uniref:BTB domain-containing protein n=1 Tax=Paraconiothyrium brasiliense TaxID=300254 RepID=A0ABR3S5W1_9PLEO
MAPSFGEVLQTKLFTFLIGSDETPIVVHGGVIARLSDPLDRLVNGHMAEAQDKVARFPDLEVEDFHRICEFAYRGTYTRPKPKQFSNDEVDAATQRTCLAEPILSFNERAIFTFNERVEPQEFVVLDDFTSPITSFYRSQLGWPIVPSDNGTWRENFALVLLGHARLYAFAEQYLAPALKNKAFEGIRDTLLGHTLFVSGLEAVIRLARFAYDNDYIPDREGKIVDPMRQVVMEYVLAHLKHFQDHTGHRQLLESQNEYASDLLDHIGNWYDPEAIYKRGKEERANRAKQETGGW